MRPIDADKLPERKFTRESAKGNDYMRGWNDAIDTIDDNEPTVERPQVEIIKELWNCRNELCLRCGKYEKAYCGACDDCRYNSENMKRWRKDSE